MCIYLNKNKFPFVFTIFAFKTLLISITNMNFKETSSCINNFPPLISAKKNKTITTLFENAVFLTPNHLENKPITPTFFNWYLLGKKQVLISFSSTVNDSQWKGNSKISSYFFLNIKDKNKFNHSFSTRKSNYIIRLGLNFPTQQIDLSNHNDPNLYNFAKAAPPH